ncbi:MAG TPA: DUF4383 domain-containing protein [Acidimicrobiia bacterium]
MRPMYGNGAVPERSASPAYRWSPAQIVAAILGVGFALLGAIALARTGFNVNHVTRPTTDVWRWHQTPILAVSEIAAGALLLLGAFRPAASRVLMWIVSIAALGLGITALIDAFPRQLHFWLGVTRADAWLYVAAGALGLVASIASPTFWHLSRRERVRRDHVVA